MTCLFRAVFHLLGQAILKPVQLAFGAVVDGRRVMPLFPELEPLLSEAFARSEEGQIYVLPKLRNIDYNPATHMVRTVEKACGKPWPRIFQNCRSTRQTELQQDHPSHVVTKWLGNSTKVAELYYLQVTEEHFEKALIPVESEAESEAKSEADCERV